MKYCLSISISSCIKIDFIISAVAGEVCNHWRKCPVAKYKLSDAGDFPIRGELLLEPGRKPDQWSIIFAFANSGISSQAIFKRCSFPSIVVPPLNPTSSSVEPTNTKPSPLGTM